MAGQPPFYPTPPSRPHEMPEMPGMAGMQHGMAAMNLNHHDPNSSRPVTRTSRIIDASQPMNRPGEKVSTAVPQLEGYFLERVEPKAGSGTKTWLKAESKPMPLTLQELSKQVQDQRRRGVKVYQKLEDLSPNQRQVILRLIEVKNAEELDRSASWVLAYLASTVRKTGVGWNARQETTRLSVILEKNVKPVNDGRAKGPLGQPAHVHQAKPSLSGPDGMRMPQPPPGMASHGQPPHGMASHGQHAPHGPEMPSYGQGPARGQGGMPPPAPAPPPPFPEHAMPPHGHGAPHGGGMGPPGQMPLRAPGMPPPGQGMPPHGPPMPPQMQGMPPGMRPNGPDRQYPQPPPPPPAGPMPMPMPMGPRRAESYPAIQVLGGKGSKSNGRPKSKEQVGAWVAQVPDSDESDWDQDTDGSSATTNPTSYGSTANSPGLSKTHHRKNSNARVRPNTSGRRHSSRGPEYRDHRETRRRSRGSSRDRRRRDFEDDLSEEDYQRLPRPDPRRRSSFARGSDLLQRRGSVREDRLIDIERRRLSGFDDGLTGRARERDDDAYLRQLAREDAFHKEKLILREEARREAMLREESLRRSRRPSPEYFSPSFGGERYGYRY